MIVTFLFELL